MSFVFVHFVSIIGILFKSCPAFASLVVIIIIIDIASRRGSYTTKHSDSGGNLSICQQSVLVQAIFAQQL